MNTANLFRKYFLISLALLMTLYRSLFIFGFRGTNCQSEWLTPIFPCRWYNVFFELILWAVVLVLFLLELRWNHGFTSFYSACAAFWPLFVFVLLAVLSLAWSVVFAITLYKVFVLLASTLMAVYIGFTLGTRRFMDYLAWFFGALCLVNLGWAWLFPHAGRWAGEAIWNGIFWHKIYLGAFTALVLSFYLLRLLDWKRLTGFSKIATVIMFFVALFLLVKSSSVAAVITAVVLAGLCLLMAAWIRWGKHLKRFHYYLFLGIAAVVSTLVLSNLDTIFGLFGRNTSLTGRIPMWSYLLEHAVSRRPLLGYGYGAFWNLEGFRDQMTLAMNFSLQVTQSDNGFMEILLHLGIAGVVLLAGLVVLGFVRAARYFLKTRTLASAFPLVLLVFALLANLTVSMLLETDSIVWALLVASQAAISIPEKAKPLAV